MAQTASNTTVSNFSESLHLDVDIEHSGIRFVGCLTMLLATVALYSIMIVLIQGQTINLIAGVVSLLLAALITTLVDRYLKKKWPTNRALKIDRETLATTRKNVVEREIDLTKQVNVLMWRFEVPRHTRVAKGWYVISCALTQDDVFIPVYTFAPPEEFTNFAFADNYIPLMKKRDLRKQQEERGALRLAGQQRRLHEAEEYRQLYGAELTSNQYQSYIAYLATRYPQWMPGN